MIRLEGIVKTVKERALLDGLDIAVDSGSLVVMTGPSGSGKTTILKLIAGFDVPQRGTITIHDTIATQGKRIITRPFDRNIGMVFQDFALWPHLTVEQNILYGLRHREIAHSSPAQRLDYVLTVFGLDCYRTCYPARLSGGERQCVALARAHAPKPSILLLDEPVSNLDDTRRKSVLEEIARLRDETRCTVIIVTHTMHGMVFSNARHLILENGRLIDAQVT